MSVKFYLEEKFQTVDDMKTELINLEAIQNLPKGTELYISDIHGEYDGFDHMLRIGSGILKEKIGELYEEEYGKAGVERLTLLVAYPKDSLKLDPYFKGVNSAGMIDVIEALINILRFISSKYTRSKLRKALPQKFAYVTEELLYADYQLPHKKQYAQGIMHQLIDLDMEEEFIIKICETIQVMAVDHLHVVGDIFDRGPDADLVMDRLMAYPSVDIQWGNHDMLWIGAYYGSTACLMTLLRIAVRYDYIFDLERAYGLNLRPLFIFAAETYDQNPAFTPSQTKGLTDDEITELEQVQQALAMIQFKLEEQILERRPEFDMAHRQLLKNIDLDAGTIEIEGETYQLKDTCFQTIDPSDLQKRSTLTDAEAEVVESLLYSFQHSDRLGQQMEFLVKNGGMYRIYNKHLLFHGCIPLTDSGEFLPVKFEGEWFAGKDLLDYFDEAVRLGASTQGPNDYYTDLFWYLWAGPHSPLFGKEKMTTFERYFIADESTHKEEKNAYYQLRVIPEIVEKILYEFELYDTRSAIINGHTPVKAKKGETPVKADGKLFVIDGGLSKAYQGKTGIAGYSLINNSYGFQVVTHQGFQSVKHLFDTNSDGTYISRVIEEDLPRIKIKETTIGHELARQIKDLEWYLDTYARKDRKYRQPALSTKK